AIKTLINKIEFEHTRLFGRLNVLSSEISELFNERIVRSALKSDKANEKPDLSKFIVTSFGYSASRWFAWALNLHPSITCTHGKNNAKLGLIYDRNFTPEEWEEVWDEAPKRFDLPLNEFFEEIKAVQPNQIQGNVHHYRIHELETIIMRDKILVDFKCADLIRNPISILESKFQANIDESNLNNIYDESLNNFASISSQWVKNNQLEAILNDHGVDSTSWETQMFLESLDTVINICKITRRYPSQKFIKMEELTTNAEYFEEQVCFLTNNTLALDESYISAVFSGKKLNQHRTVLKKHTANKVFQSWENWKKEVVIDMFYRNSVQETFTEIGYDLTFVQ
ncbi:hypothetical protein N9361_01840, partial [Alphaproteobacteria bacterium]|nr:hypothetical protein [Alphaproteobacteria bacterium]